MDELKSANQLDDLPHKWVDVVVDYLRGFRNDTTDFNRPQLRPSVRHTYPAFVCGYSALIMAGALCNAYVLAIVARKRLYAADPVYVYVANLAVTGIVECVSVLPISLMVLLVQNWIFGRFLCFFLPMLQLFDGEHAMESPMAPSYSPLPTRHTFNRAEDNFLDKSIDHHDKPWTSDEVHSIQSIDENDGPDFFNLIHTQSQFTTSTPSDRATYAIHPTPLRKLKRRLF